MKESDARQKACPFAATFAASQQIAEGPGPHCIASSCMAWRPVYEDRGMHGTHVEAGGFCGLAGSFAQGPDRWIKGLRQ